MLFLVSLVFLLKSAFSDWSITDIKTEEIIQTDFGDEFLIKYHYTDFPEKDTNINIYDNKNNIRIISVLVDGRYDKTNIINLIETTDIRCYEMYNKLIYKVDNDDFKSVDIDDINELNPAEYQSLVKVCNILYDKAEWKWVKACSKFLITTGNSDVLEHL
jgi:hypothetical protein